MNPPEPPRASTASTKTRKKSTQQAQEPQGILTQQMAAMSALLEGHTEAISRLESLPGALSQLKDLIADKTVEVNQASGHPSVDEDDIISNDNIDDTIADLLKKSEEASKPDTPMTLIEVLNESQPEPEYGLDLQKDIADAFTRLGNQQSSRPKVDAWKETLKVPANCKVLGVPRINAEIWNVLTPRSRQVDFQHQQSQKMLSMASVAVARLADKIFALNREIPDRIGQELLRMTMDIASMLSQANQESNMKRKQEIKPNLSKDIQSVCSAKIVTTEYLFGDNVSEQIKACKSVATALKSSSDRFNQNYRFTPYYNRGMSNSSAFRGSSTLNYNRASSFQRGGPQFRAQTRGSFRRGSIRQQFQKPQNPQSFQ